MNALHISVSLFTGFTPMEYGKIDLTGKSGKNLLILSTYISSHPLGHNLPGRAQVSVQHWHSWVGKRFKFWGSVLINTPFFFKLFTPSNTGMQV